MSDLTNRVKTVFSADTTGAQAAVKALRGVERDRAKEMLDGLNKENAALESSLSRWVKLGAGIAGVGAAFVAGKALAHDYLEDLRLETAAAGIHVDKLTTATRGLVEQDKLLEFAGRTKAGMWHLNEQEMEKVLQGAMAIRKVTGQELVPVIDALTESLSKGNTRALKEFGIEATDKAKVLDELSAKWRSLGGDADVAGDDVTRSGVKLSDAFDDMKSSLGELVIGLRPFVDLLADALELLNEGVRALSAPDLQSKKNLEFGAQLPGAFGDQMRARLTRVGISEGITAGVGRLPTSAGGSEIVAIEDALQKTQAYVIQAGAANAAELARKAVAKSRARGGGAGGGAGGDFAGDPIGFGTETYSALQGGVRDVSGAFAGVYQDARASQWETLGNGAMSGGDKRFGEEMAGIKQDWLEQGAMDKMLAAQAEAEQHKKFLESVFGSPDDISAMTTTLKLAHTAVEGITGAIAGTLEAFATSSMSAGAVFKRATGVIVHAMGDELAAVAAKNLILAGVDLATFNFPGALRHGTAAAIAGVGAVGMYALAGKLGYGESSNAPTGPAAHGAAGAALGGGGGSGGDKAGNQTTYIYLTPDWDDETPSQRRQKLARAVRRGGVNRSSNIVLHR